MNKNSRIAVAFFTFYSTLAEGPADHKYRRSTTRFNLYMHKVDNLIVTRTEAANHSGTAIVGSNPI
jgi:hypothetical protein